MLQPTEPPGQGAHLFIYLLILELNCTSLYKPVTGDLHVSKIHYCKQYAMNNYVHLACCILAGVSAWAFITKYHRLGGLGNRNLIFHNSGGSKAETGVPAWSDESAPLPASARGEGARKQAVLVSVLTSALPSTPPEYNLSQRPCLHVPSLWGLQCQHSNLREDTVQSVTAGNLKFLEMGLLIPKYKYICKFLYTMLWCIILHQRPTWSYPDVRWEAWISVLIFQMAAGCPQTIHYGFLYSTDLRFWCHHILSLS